MPLFDSTIRGAKSKDRDYKLTDALGLYVLVRPNGSKLWQMRYRFGGKQKTLSLGTYPQIGLADAREKRDEARRQIALGEDPMAVKREKALALRVAEGATFAAVAQDWLDKITREGRSEATLAKNTWLLRDLVFPFLGNRPIAGIKPIELLDVIQKVERRGKFETAARLRSICGTVFRYAVASGRAERDIAADLKGAITVNRSKPRAAIIDPAEIGRLLARIDSYQGRGVTLFALRLSPLVFLRPIELRTGEWSEIEFDNALWRIPADKMKMRREHLVPLSKQAITLLKDLHPLTGHGRFLFPATGPQERPISENTVRQAILKLGYTKEQMSAHGFRRMASTRLNEMGFNRDWIERQLAHADEDQIRSVYNAAEWLPQRRAMMQEWADYLDGLRAKAIDREVEDLIG